MITVLCYKKCTTCQKAFKWLDANGVEYKERAIKEENPTYEELKTWYEKSGLPLKKFFNTSGMLYKELGLKDKLLEMSEEEQLKLLSTDGMLVKRPLVVGEKTVLTGFSENDFSTTHIRKVPLQTNTQKEALVFENAGTLLIADEKDKSNGGNLYRFRF